ncbi:hypothetical protein DRO61_08365 [Candidatus Bathyarchaeota archaeon]|nr:MAG: hypothetical protein DRO61_08365 [Candidatus Bathyarchaeota archaeon]
MNVEEKKRLLREHPEYVNLIHYVKGSGRQKGYWRVIPYTYFNPTINQLAHRRNFAKIAYNNYGKKGFINDTPIIAYEIGEEMKRLRRRRGLYPKERELRAKLNKLALTKGICLRIKVPKFTLRI